VFLSAYGGQGCCVSFTWLGFIMSMNYPRLNGSLCFLLISLKRGCKSNILF